VDTLTLPESKMRQLRGRGAAGPWWCPVIKIQHDKAEITTVGGGKNRRVLRLCNENLSY
jgi:hypothetical protein